MRNLALLPLLVLSMLFLPAHAGEERIGAGCTITATSPTVGSSADDADCSWASGAALAIQCDVAVYVTKDGNDPTSASPRVAVGDPYPLDATDSSTGRPVKTLTVAATTAHTCYVYKRDLSR